MLKLKDIWPDASSYWEVGGGPSFPERVLKYGELNVIQYQYIGRGYFYEKNEVRPTDHPWPGKRKDIIEWVEVRGDLDYSNPGAWYSGACSSYRWVYIGRTKNDRFFFITLSTNRFDHPIDVPGKSVHNDHESLQAAIRWCGDIPKEREEKTAKNLVP
jgi:hypothetical protein